MCANGFREAKNGKSGTTLQQGEKETESRQGQDETGSGTKLAIRRTAHSEAASAGKEVEAAADERALRADSEQRVEILHGGGGAVGVIPDAGADGKEVCACRDQRPRIIDRDAADRDAGHVHQF